MTLFTGADPSLLRPFVVQYHNWVVENVDQPVFHALEVRPRELELLFTKLNKLRELLDRPPADIGPDLLPVLKTAVIHARRIQAFDIERRSVLTANHDLRVKFEEDLRLFSIIMDQEWFKETETTGLVRTTDFLSIQHAEQYGKKTSLQLNPRIYDEKFHILNGPSLFISDLAYYRETCGLRGVPLCVAYIDIDDFKSFNTRYGEPRVDRDVLPRFMSALEAHVYHHGHAYRFGGDEYVMLLPNSSRDQAIGLLSRFQQRLRNLEYFEIEMRIEVSIGIFEVNEYSVQTDREIEERAAFAKKFAKDNGKNCIAAYDEPGFRDEDVHVVR